MPAVKVIGSLCPKHPEADGLRRGVLRNGSYTPSWCVVCLKEYNRSYRIKNHEKAKEELSKWRANNKVKIRIQKSKWKERNREKITEQQRQANLRRAIRNKSFPELDWQKNNREHARSLAYEWRNKNRDKYLASIKHSCTVRKRLLGSQAISKNYSKEIREIYKNCPDGHHVDHIVPLRGKLVNGLHVPWNLQYLPAAENLYKANSHA